MAKQPRKPVKKMPSKAKALKGGWREQWRHAWVNTLGDMLRQPLSTLLTVPAEICFSVVSAHTFLPFFINFCTECFSSGTCN